MPVFKSTRFHSAAFVLSVAAISVGAQTHFTFTSATGNNMTVIVQTAINPTVNGQPMAPGDEIGVFTPAGLCVGARVWDGVHNRSIAVWGDNDMTPIVDGAKGGEALSYRIWDSSLAQEVLATVTYDTLPPATARGTYAVDGIAILASLIAPPLPPAPVLVSPVNVATGVSVAPTLVWDTTVGATSYVLELATDSSFVSIVLSDTITSTYQGVSGLSNGTQYYWRVMARNTSGSSAWSTVWSFTTTGTGGLTAPVLILPANSATGVSTGPTMAWYSVAGALTYEIQVSTTGTFASLVVDDTLTDTAEAISGLSGGTQYYWRVNASNGSGTSVWSSVWSFTTSGGGGGLAAPILISPVNGATGISITPTLVWDTTAGATNYLLQVATDSSFISIILSDSTITSTSRVLSSLVNSTTYYWRVRAENAGGSSAWSTVWSFTTGPNSFVVHYPTGPQEIARKPVTVYNLLGRRVSRGGPVEYRAMTSGCYIYKTGDQIKKNASLR